MCPQPSAHRHHVFLNPTDGPQWKVYDEYPMLRTGLILRPVSAARVAHALGQNPDPDENLETMLDLGRWQQDWVFVSAQHKRIALVSLCRSADGLPDQLTAAGTIICW
jgi:hypothetical protein